MRTSFLLVSLAALMVSCGEQQTAASGASGGTMVMGIPGDAGTMLPPFASDQISREVCDQLYDRLAEIGPDLNWAGDAGFQPRLARSWTWSKDSLSIAFAIDPRARWHDGQPVRSSDVRFTFDVNKDPATKSIITPNLVDIDSVTTPDSLTAVAWFKRRSPDQFYNFTYQLYILPEHVLKAIPHDQLGTSPAARAPIGTGRFRFVRWEPGVRIEVVADTQNYRGRAKLDRVIWTIASDGAAAVTQLLKGESDFMDNLSVDLLPRIDSVSHLKVIRLPQSQFAYLQFNLRDPARGTSANPIFGDVRVRRAVSMALDREAMLRNVFDTTGVIGKGPFPTGLAVEGITLLPFDRVHAAALLDSAGWRAGPNGVRTKGGRPLHFTILLPNSSRTRMRYGVLIQEQLKSVGADVAIDVVAFPEFVARMESRKFDAAMYLFNTDPSPAGNRESWGSMASKPGAQNYSSYESPSFDGLLDTALTSPNAARARESLRRAYQQLVDDAPAVWLYDPSDLAGVHKRIHTEGLRADAWWANLPDWWIPADQRIDRDKIGLRPASGASQ